MTFDQFYDQQYLPRHPLGVCRLFHLMGPPLGLVLLGATVWLQIWWLLILLPVPFYGLAWLGHVLVPNQPTFFEHPFYSFLGYWRMVGGMTIGRVRATR